MHFQSKGKYNKVDSGTKENFENISLLLLYERGNKSLSFIVNNVETATSHPR